MRQRTINGKFPMTREMQDRIDKASTEFYCSWGHHRTWKASHVEERFDHGTMCMECQIKIADSLGGYIFVPDNRTASIAAMRRQFDAAREQGKAVAKIRKGSNDEGFVYYMRINGQIKIGYAADVTSRMRHYPPGSELLAVEPGTLHTEAERHQDFRRDLVRGREWFNESDKLIAHIAQIVSDCGDPSALAYQFTERKQA